VLKSGAFMKLCVRVLAASLCLMSLHLIAQEAQRGPDSSMSFHVPGVDVLPVSGKPFSAKSRTEWTRPLADGSTLQQHLTANLARDSQGRVYRERRSFMPGLSNEETRLTHIMIFDPVAQSQTICTVALHKCVVSAYHAQTSFREMPAGSFDGGKRYLNRESLGSNTMDGLEVTGTRETITVSPGTVGNENPIVSTREFWYSAELQTNLAVTRKLPLEGLQVVQLSDVSTGEPAPELFQAPAGFVIEDTRPAN
jgi:hypothetical protein